MPEQRAPHVKLNLRLSPALHRRLQQAAKRNNSNLQQEITERLERSLDQNLEAATATAVFLDKLASAGFIIPPKPPPRDK